MPETNYNKDPESQNHLKYNRIVFIIVICASRPESAYFRFLAEAQPRLETSEDKRHFLAEVHIKCFRRPHELGTIKLK
jgi:hypothetical protein